MTVDNSGRRRWSPLIWWADVDPARYPFDPADALTVVQALAPPVPPRPIRQGFHVVGTEEAFQWFEAMTHALVNHYGPWARRWYWSTGVGGYDGRPVTDWWHYDECISTPAETLVRVADSLVGWRRW